MAVTMELTGDQLKLAELQLKQYLPHSLSVYGTLVLKNRIGGDPVNVLVDEWPKFKVIIGKPQYEQESDVFKDIVVYAVDDIILKETMRESSVIDWSRCVCIDSSVSHMDIIKDVAAEKDVAHQKLSVCHKMILQDVSKLPDIDSAGITLSSLDESHIDLVNQTWKFGQNDGARRMIRSMIKNFPSCCVLDANGKPVSWILTYSTCSIGILYTQPEHREKGFATVIICSMARRNHALGYPVYCFIEEENALSYKIFQKLGFTRDSSSKEIWCEFNHF